MQDLLELPNNPSLFSLSCKVANGVHEPIINNIEARSVQFSCENQFRKNVVTRPSIKYHFTFGSSTNTLLYTCF
jgi:hypothetical protein